MVTRRGVVAGGLATGAATLGAGFFSGTAAANTGRQATVNPIIEQVDGRLLVNKPRAYEVMDREGMDGLVALDPLNVFYLGNFLGFYVKIRSPYPSFAVLPRAEDKPSILIVGNLDTWELVNGDREYPEIIAYTAGGPKNWEAYSDPNIWDKEPQPGMHWADFWVWHHDNLSEREERWAAVERKYKDDVSPSPEYALGRALKESGLDTGKVAVDDMRIANVLDRVGLKKVTCVDGDNIFRKIRMVKSDIEVAHMRNIARVNQAATFAALKRLGPGATNKDISRLFMQEAAIRGAKPVWMQAGTTGGLEDGAIKAGQSFLVDAVSEINLYHGDIGRSVVYGEPSKKLIQRTELLRIGWQAVFEAMKPGVTYSELQKVGMNAMKKSGLPQMHETIIVPHSVGLQHTDESYRDGLPFVVKDDHVLQENMVLTVDFPNLEPGWGSCHLEDLVVVTKDGAEALGSMDGSLIVL